MTKVYKKIMKVLYFIYTFPKRRNFVFKHLVSGSAMNLNRQLRVFHLVNLTVSSALALTRQCVLCYLYTSLITSLKGHLPGF